MAKNHEFSSSILFSSNRLEVLAEQLGRVLFAPSSSPFASRMVITGHKDLKEYLFSYFARHRDFQIAAGIEVYTWQESLDKCLLLLKEKKRIPSLLEGSIYLEQEIRFFLAQKEPLFAPLWHYLELEGRDSLEKAPLKTFQKLSSFCGKLSALFLRYAVFGGEFALQWRKKEGWQQLLWERLWGKEAPWLCPLELLEKPFSVEFPLHFFAIPFLPKLYQVFFKECVRFSYFLSPCQLFWEDLSTSKEKAYLQKSWQRQGVQEGKREELSRYLATDNPFLANMGKVGRESLKNLEEENPLTYDHYVDPREEVLHPSLLQRVQADLLTLRSPQDTPLVSLAEEDRSLQLHATSSKLREVEVLLDTIYTLLDKHKNDPTPILPQDILVLAPDIGAYVPYIHAVLGQEGVTIDYTIRDLEWISQSLFAQGLQQLLSLAKSRFEPASVLQFLRHPQVLEKFQLQQEGVHQIEEWVEKAHIRWGIDKEHRQKILFSQDPLEETGSWQYGLERLLYGLILLSDEEDLGAIPHLEWSDAELLGKVIRLIRSLGEDLSFLSAPQERSLSDWGTYIDSLAESYFALEEEDRGFLRELGQLFSLDPFQEGICSFESILKVLEQFFQRKNSSFQPSYLHAVRFGSLKAGSRMPAKVICLLGMEDEAYPRVESKHPLCEMSGSQADYCPSRVEEDRYVFLEQLLSARQYFVMSYQRFSVKDHKEQEPSLVVQELFSYIDSAYCKNQAPPSPSLCLQHPVLPFDKSYFAEKALFTSYNERYFQVARAYYTEKKHKLEPFFPGFFTPSPIKTPPPLQEPLTLEIRHLTKLARHPIQFYFNQVLQVFLETEDETEQKEFILSPLDRAMLRKASLQTSPSQVFSQAEKKGALPTGMFKKVAALRLQEEVAEVSSYLTAMGVSPGEKFSIELKKNCRAPFLGPQNCWFLPPLEVPLDESSVVIIGKIEEIVPQGLLFHGKDELKDLLKIWPLFLVYLCLPPFSQELAPYLLLSKEGVKKEALPNPLPLLQDFLRYYRLSLENPTPLMPEWSQALLCKDAETFEKALRASQSSFTGYKDPYLDWLFSRDSLPSATALYHTWAGPLRQVFAPLLEKELS